MYQYIDSKEKEHKKVFIEEQLKTYIELSDVASRIVTSKSGSAEQRKATNEYWRLAFGKAAMFTNSGVQEAIFRMSGYVVHCVEKRGTPPQKDYCSSPMDKAYALGIASAARDSFVSTFDVPLEKLDSKHLYEITQ